MAQREIKELTVTQKEFITCVKTAFNGIADCQNIAMELGWKKSKVGIVAKKLEQAGIISISYLPQSFEGNIYKMINPNLLNTEV